jgi:hypothetical protein
MTALHARVLRAGAHRLHFSNPAPLNRAGNPLPWLARDLEAEARKGAKESLRYRSIHRSQLYQFNLQPL